MVTPIRVWALILVGGVGAVVVMVFVGVGGLVDGLASVFDLEHFDDLESEVIRNAERTLNSLQESHLLILDASIGEDQVTGKREGSLAEFVGDGGGGFGEGGLEALLVEQILNLRNHCVELGGGLAAEEFHTVGCSEEKLLLLVRDTAVGGNSEKQDSGNQIGRASCRERVLVQV